MAYEAAFQTIYIVTVQGKNGSEQLVFMDDAFVEA
jgi:hypothetical protein